MSAGEISLGAGTVKRQRLLDRLAEIVAISLDMARSAFRNPFCGFCSRVHYEF
jgi:hypothetical protein